MSKKLDLIGQRFGRLLVLGEASPRKMGDRMLVQWSCQCDCGESITVGRSNLRTGNTRSCGCLGREVANRALSKRTKHGQYKTSEYKAWVSMRNRCLSPACASYPDYGGRGITVCDRRLNSFEAFIADMGPKPSPRQTLERINNECGYGPDNCRWATFKEQALNRRITRYVTFQGVSMPLKTLAERHAVVQYVTLLARLRAGWPVEEAVLTPPLSRQQCRSRL